MKTNTVNMLFNFDILPFMTYMCYIMHDERTTTYPIVFL